MRVGLGHDSHRLVAGGPLRLAGVSIPHDRHLAGHSDADVVLHAITDALLGAAGMGDIGDAYPDTDPAYRGCDSARFINETIGRLGRAGWQVVNVDVTILAEQPRIGPHKQAMRERLASLLGVDPTSVNVKAKTGEGSGAVGRGEVVCCQAVALLDRTPAVVS